MSNPTNQVPNMQNSMGAAQAQMVQNNGQPQGQDVNQQQAVNQEQFDQSHINMLLALQQQQTSQSNAPGVNGAGQGAPQQMVNGQNEQVLMQQHQQMMAVGGGAAGVPNQSEAEQQQMLENMTPEQQQQLQMQQSIVSYGGPGAQDMNNQPMGQQAAAAFPIEYEFKDEIDQQAENGQTEQIYTYECDFQNYSIAFRNRKDNKFHMAVASYNTDTMNNKVDIISLNLRKPDDGFCKINEFKHDFPTTKMMWIPDIEGNRQDILATTAECLRIWEMNEETNQFIEHKVTRNTNSDYCAPITSFDWNTHSPQIIGTSSIDTTCTIWDIQQNCVQTQLIAHDSAVFDICFRDENLFASSGEDGSVRHFDLRDLEHSTIIYESPNKQPLLRVAWNKRNIYQLATIQQHCNDVMILDFRYPMKAVRTLKSHSAQVNSIAWAPHSQNHICTAGDDHQTLIWCLNSQDGPTAISTDPNGNLGDGHPNSQQTNYEDPYLAYGAEGPVHQLLWCQSRSKWISIAFQDKLQVLRI